jgi:tRNA-splicing ligase RtcB
MQVEKQDNSLPIKIWAEDADEGVMEQARHLAQLPFAVNSVALMPDAHKGYGMPIGGVMATNGVVVPNAVGVDIGCGMRVCRLDVTVESVSREQLTSAMGAIRKVVPVGFAHQQSRQLLEWSPGGEVGRREKPSAEKQIGTLGGGNHFIEIQAGDDGLVYVMIHSGSRNVGKQVADFYNKKARALNAQWHSQVPDKWELAFLPLDDQVGQDYFTEMQDCVEFARLNRELMLKNILGVLGEQWGIAEGLIENSLDIAHNYAALEHHHNRNLLVHRKGATRARAGELGIIPGSQGTKSYIVRGLGNVESFESCSHGAGRRMGRKQAERELDLAGEIQKLNDAGIVHSVRGKGDLDEAPGAYKDIDVVMAAQQDLVEIITTLKPLGVIKG